MTWSTDPEALFAFPRGSFGDELRISTLVHPEDKTLTEAALASALGTGVYQVEYRAVRPDGTVVWLTDRGRIVADPVRGPGRMIGITRDITAERRAVQEREALLRDAREARDAAESANRAKDEFLAMLSHELRNPLNVIASGVEVLNAVGGRDAKAARPRQLIAKQVEHLTHLLDDLLDISRVTSRKIDLHPRAMDLGAAVERCLATLRDTAGPARHTWRTSLASVWIDGDETRVDQIITNLATNAIRFTPDGGEIHVAVAEDGRDAVLRIRDTGVGIEPQLLPRVFDLFVQGDRSVDRSHGGLGLGLTLVRQLTEMHGGTVEATSDGPGRGAAFTVRLPRVAPALDRTAAPSVAAATSARRILLVEDNADGRELVQMMLELEGHEVHAVADGESAVAAFRQVRPTVVIIDIGLPGIDGYTLAARLRLIEADRSALRLIALTGYGTEADRRRAADAGFDAHLTKPVEPNRLAELLSTSTDRGSQPLSPRPPSP
jgi:signal transduction histidine kinase/CheY-like chemotaxis protein